MTQFLVNRCVRSAGSAGGRAVTRLRHSPIAHQVAVALLDDVALMDATLALAEDRFVALTARSQDRPWRAAKGRGCVKTSARSHTSLFRSLLRGLRAFRVEKIAKNLALLDRLQNVAEFLHGLGRSDPFAKPSRNGRYLPVGRENSERGQLTGPAFTTVRSCLR
jgi:hypothetical protein